VEGVAVKSGTGKGYGNEDEEEDEGMMGEEGGWSRRKAARRLLLSVTVVVVVVMKLLLLVVAGREEEARVMPSSMLLLLQMALSLLLSLLSLLIAFSSSSATIAAAISASGAVEGGRIGRTLTPLGKACVSRQVGHTRDSSWSHHASCRQSVQATQPQGSVRGVNDASAESALAPSGHAKSEKQISQAMAVPRDDL